jgi:glycosyltransferase involved in cell wall biosynthesis
MELTKGPGTQRLHFLGRLDHQEMPAFMASLDLFVIPSLTETLPTSLLEALATGTPVMASAVGGVAEFLQSGWGIALKAGETKAIVRALEQWLPRRKDLRRLGEQGQAYVHEQHNWELTSKLTEGVYRSCLEQR